MAFIEIVNEDRASGSVKDDYDAISSRYSRFYDQPVLTPQVYRSTSLVPEYFHLCTEHVDAMSKGGTDPLLSGKVPGQLIAFGVSQHSSCFY